MATELFRWATNFDNAIKREEEVVIRLLDFDAMLLQDLESRLVLEAELQKFRVEGLTIAVAILSAFLAALVKLKDVNGVKEGVAAYPTSILIICTLLITLVFTILVSTRARSTSRRLAWAASRASRYTTAKSYESNSKLLQ